MYSRVAALLAYGEDVRWLMAPGPYTAHYHMTHRLINIVIARKEMYLELEQVEMTLE